MANDDLAKLTVLEADTKSIELGTLWRDRGAVLVKWQHASDRPDDNADPGEIIAALR